MTKSVISAKKLNILCVVLMLALTICQFVPFWSMDGQTASISGYIWFPEDHTDFTAHFEQIPGNEDFKVVNLVVYNAVIMLGGLASAVLCIWKPNSVWPGALGVLCGLAGTVGYASKPVFHLGAGWQFHLILSIFVLLAAAGNLIYQCKSHASS